MDDIRTKNQKPIYAVFTLFCLLIFQVSVQAKSKDPSLDWQTLETAHFRIHFTASQQSIALQTQKIAEQIHQKLTQKLNWQPKSKTALILSDATDFANGYANNLPKNRSTLFLQPPTNTFVDYTSWLESLIIHEYTHILHIDKATGAPGVMQKIFGRLGILFPNRFQPNWFIEGLATYIETDKSLNIGRGQNSHFEMMMRLEVDRGIKPLSQVNTSNSHWPINQSYLYGEHFHRFVAHKYGEDKVVALSDEYGNDLLPWFINRNAEKVLGKNLTTLWQEFRTYLTDRYQVVIDQIYAAGIKEGMKITTQGFSSQAVEATDNGIYYIRNNGLEQVMLMFRDNNGVLSEISAINGAASLDWHSEKGLLVAQAEVCNEFNIYFDLYQLKPGSNDLQRLTQCGRYHSAQWSADGDSIIALKSSAALFSLHKLTVKGQYLKTLWQGKEEVVVSQFDVSNDGKRILMSMRDGKIPRIQLKELNLESKQWKNLSQGFANHVYPKYSRDGKHIYYSADYSGVYNFYEMNINTKTIQGLTNVLGGVFQFSEGFVENNFFYVGYSHQGFDIYQYKKPNMGRPITAFRNKVVKIPEIIKDIDVVKAPDIKPYSPWQSITPAYWLPFAGSDEDNIEIGIQTSGSDALGIHQYALALGTNLDKKTVFGQVNYFYSYYLNLSFDRSYEYNSQDNHSGTYLLEEQYDLSFQLPFSQIQSQWNIQLGVSSDHLQRGFYDDDDLTRIERFHDDVVGLSISFNNSERFFKSISKSNGRQINFTAETSDVLKSDFSGEVYIFDWREFIQLNKEHTLAMRFVQGWGSDKSRPFRLGGEDSDTFIINDNNFNERSFTLRGYPTGLTQLSGQRMQLTNLEYRFPVVQIEKTLMAPPIGIGKISAAVFIDAGRVYRHSPNEHYTGAGVELHTQLKLFYALALDFRIGYAKGFDLGGENRAYINLGRVF